MDSTADAVIIGAGVIGSAIALELARFGHKVIVVDRGHGPANGSTSASTAIVRFDYSTYPGVALAWESAQCWVAWADHLDAPHLGTLAAFRRTGAIALDAPIVPEKRTIELYEQAGVPAQRWTADDLRENVPAIDPGRFWPPKPVDHPDFWSAPDGEIGATYVPAGGYIDDPMLATANLAAAARARGVRFVFGTGITAICTMGGRVTGVRTVRDGTIAAPIVVNAAGPWSGAINRLAGVGDGFTIGVRPLRVEVHQVPAPDGYAAPGQIGPVIGDVDLGIYLRTAPGNVMLVGGTEPDCDELDWAADPDSVPADCTVAVHDRQVLRASRRFPNLKIPLHPRGVVGVYDVADDWIPIYDKTELAGYYIAMGTSGNQFKNAPVVGQLMAALIKAVESGVDHDASPVVFDCAHTANRIDLSAFSRHRQPNQHGTGTVLG